MHPRPHHTSPALRITPAEALRHPFLTQPDPPAHHTAAMDPRPASDVASSSKAEAASSKAPRSPRVAATTATAHHHHGPYGVSQGQQQQQQLQAALLGAGADAGTQT